MLSTLVFDRGFTVNSIIFDAERLATKGATDEVDVVVDMLSFNC